MSGFNRRGFTIREGDAPLSVDPASKQLKASHAELFEAQEHRRRSMPWPKSAAANALLTEIEEALRAQDYERCYTLCAALQESEGTDWATANNAALCLFMLGDVEGALALWQWAAQDMESHRDPETLDASYLPFERPFTDEEWRRVYSTVKVNSGEVHWEAKRYEAAKADMEDAVANTTAPAALVPRLMKAAQVSLDAGDAAGASAAARRAVEAAQEVDSDWRALVEREITALEDTFTKIRPLFESLVGKDF